jgi:hypothetical protein
MASSRRWSYEVWQQVVALVVKFRVQGHGMEDNVYMPIVEDKKEQVATLAVSPDEYVVDAHTMSALGNGNAD